MADKVLGWEDPLPTDENERKAFTCLPDGDYWFRVMKVEQGTASTDGAPMAQIEMLVKSVSGDAWVTDRIKMVETMIWKLQQFFSCVGLRQHGQPFRMNWSAVPGTFGYARLKTTTISQGRFAGQKRNEIERYLDEPTDEEPPAWCCSKKTESQTLAAEELAF